MKHLKEEVGRHERERGAVADIFYGTVADIFQDTHVDGTYRCGGLESVGTDGRPQS
jgi:hypothetical protein